MSSLIAHVTVLEGEPGAHPEGTGSILILHTDREASHPVFGQLEQSRRRAGGLRSAILEPHLGRVRPWLCHRTAEAPGRKQDPAAWRNEAVSPGGETGYREPRES
jgi:hypothetical protein